MRGRKADAPALQVAKGNPKKARRKTLEQRAADLASKPAVSSGMLSPPAYLLDESLAEAAKIWRELAPDLARLNLLGRLDRYSFARWCVYQADWIEATRSITKDGIWMNVPNVNGELMPRRNPACMHRDRCEINMQALEAAFGLTPAHRYKVLRDQSAAAGNNPDLFNRPAGKPADTPSPEAPEASPIGLIGRLGATPPGQRPN